MINFLKAIKEVSRRKKDDVGSNRGKDSVWQVEGMVNQIYVSEQDLENLESITLNNLKTHITMVGCEWDEDSKQTLKDIGVEFIEGTDMHNDELVNLVLPVNTFAIMNQDGTECLLIENEVYAKITSKEVTRFIQAPKQRFIRLYNNEGLLIYTQTTPYLEEELDKLLKASKYVSFMKHDEEHITIKLQQHMTFKTVDGLNQLIGYNGYPLITFGKDEITIHSTIQAGVSKTYTRQSASTTVILSSVNGLKAGDCIKFVDNKDSEYEAEIISVNKRDRTIRVLETPIWLKPGSSAVDCNNTVNIRSVKSVKAKNKAKGTDYASVTINGVREIGSFIRNRKEGETIEDIIHEFLQDRYPNYDTKPYMYWKYDK